jgi:serine/threonine protein kinase
MIKVMPASNTHINEIPFDLVREATILGSLQHLGIPRVYDYGVFRDRPWIAYELIEGVPLASGHKRGSMDFVELACLVCDLAAILAYAHDRGVVHGGLNPAAITIPIARQGCNVAIIDWSCACASDSPLSRPLVPLQAWPCLAPEQVRQAASDRAADVFSLGAIARQLMHFTPRDEASPELISLIVRMLAPEPGDRPTSHEVRSTASYLADQLSTQSHDPRLMITSEIAPSASGEIRQPAHDRRGIITSEIAPSASGEIREPRARAAVGRRS